MRINLSFLRFTFSLYSLSLSLYKGLSFFHGIRALAGDAAVSGDGEQNASRRFFKVNNYGGRGKFTEVSSHFVFSSEWDKARSE